MVMQSRIESLALIETRIWQELQQAAQQPGHEWRTMALATVESQEAQARTVVLREVDGIARELVFFTDARSPKVLQMQASPQGTLLCFPLSKPLRHFQHPALLAKETAEQGGLSFVCHGELWKTNWDAPGLHGAEIVNLHAGAMTVNKLGTLSTALALPMRSLCERISYRDPDVLREYDRQLQQRHPFTPVGGNDAHANIRVFGPLGGTIGTYREIFLTLSTHVLATELSEAALLDAFRAGRTYVSFDIFGDGAGFDFRVEDHAGTVHVGGATVAASDAELLSVQTPRVGRIRLLRDGVEVDSRLAQTFQTRNLPVGVYRVEVETEHGEPWLFSSSIRITNDSVATTEPQR